MVPRVVNLSQFTGSRQAITRQANAPHAVEEQITFAVFTHGVARVDTTGNLQVDRIAPRASNVVGVHGENRLFIPGTCRNIDIKAAIMFHQIHRPDRTQWSGDRRADGSPVHEIAGMPDDDSGIRVERRERHIVVFPILEDGGVGMVAGDNGIEICAIAQISPSLTFKAFAPVDPPLTLRVMVELRLSGRLPSAGLHGFDYRPDWSLC